jgi:hypothetical protein
MGQRYDGGHCRAARLPCVGSRAVAEAKRPRHGGGPWVGGMMRWHFAAASQRPPPRRKRCKTGVEVKPPPSEAERRPLHIMACS